jgi:hypothetical protein
MESPSRAETLIATSRDICDRVCPDVRFGDTADDGGTATMGATLTFRGPVVI